MRIPAHGGTRSLQDLGTLNQRVEVSNQTLSSSEFLGSSTTRRES